MSTTTMIQIRNVPTQVHREAKVRAARAGMTLSEFALQALERELRRPTAAELAARVRLLEPIPDAPSGAQLVREGRREAEPRGSRGGRAGKERSGGGEGGRG